MAILTAILNTLMVLLSLFLICLILIQRGKGGGLAGAFGGVGGSSAFGTKAGDIFTRVTMIVATVWIFLSLILVILYNQPSKSAFDDGTSETVSKTVAPKKSTPKTGTGASTPPITVTPGGAAATEKPADTKPADSLPAAIPDTPAAPAAPK